MYTIDEFSELWDQMLEDEGIWKGAVEMTSDKLVNVNKQQLLDGLDSTGMPMPFYKPYTMRSGELYSNYKSGLNPRNGGRYDMNLTGKSFDSMRGYFEGDRFRIIGEGHAAAFNRGSISFAPDLRGRIFGVYENDYLRDYRQKYLYPLIVDLIKAYTGAE